MNDLESTIMKALLDGSGEDLEALRMQLSRSKVSEREHTGVGFWTHFAVPSDAPHLSRQHRIHLDDVSAVVEGVENGMGFVLWIDKGRIDCLEGFTYEGALPAQPRLLGWRYLVPDGGGRGGLVEATERDVASVLRSLAG